MPIYEYRCRKGHTFEVMQAMSDDPVAACQECRAPVERVFRPVAVHFKGSGFYTTDYGRKRSASDDSGGGNGAKGESGESGDSKESASAKPDTSDSKSGTSSTSD